MSESIIQQNRHNGFITVQVVVGEQPIAIGADRAELLHMLEDLATFSPSKRQRIMDSVRLSLTNLAKPPFDYERLNKQQQDDFKLDCILALVFSLKLGSADWLKDCPVQRPMILVESGPGPIEERGGFAEGALEALGIDPGVPVWPHQLGMKPGHA